MVWLCGEHATKLKVMVLSEESGEVKLKAANQPWLDAMVECLRVEQQLPFEFKENKKSKRKAAAKPERVQDIEKKLRRSMSRSATTLGGDIISTKVLAPVKSEKTATPQKSTETNTVKLEVAVKKQEPPKTNDTKESAKQPETKQSEIKEPQKVTVETKESNYPKIEPKPEVDKPALGTDEKVDQPALDTEEKVDQPALVNDEKDEKPVPQQPKKGQASHRRPPTTPNSSTKSPPQSKTCVLS